MKLRVERLPLGNGAASGRDGVLGGQVAAFFDPEHVARDDAVVHLVALDLLENGRFDPQSPLLNGARLTVLFAGDGQRKAFAVSGNGVDDNVVVARIGVGSGGPSIRRWACPGGKRCAPDTAGSTARKAV